MCQARQYYSSHPEQYPDLLNVQLMTHHHGQHQEGLKQQTSEPSSTPSPSLPTPPPEDQAKAQSFTPPALPVASAASAGFNSFYSSLYNSSKGPGSVAAPSTSPSQSASAPGFPGYSAAAGLQQPQYALPSLDQLRSRPMLGMF